jgi:hypothetical protein
MTTFLNVTDRATTTLYTTINSSNTTIVLNTGDGALFPSTNFIITIENERILIDSRSTDTLTVNVSGRGYTGSTAASHTAGVAVQLRVTAQSITEMQSAINACEVVANKDTTTTLGTSDTKYPSQNAVKTYVNNQTPNLVNASELLNTYETLELPILNNNTTIFYGWLASSVTNASQGLSASSAFLVTTGSSFTLSTLLPGSGAQQNYRYDEGKIIKIKARLKFNTGGSIRGFGLAITPANIYTAQTDTTNGEIRFVLNNTTLYAQNANGTSTSTNVTGSLTLSNWNTYEIVFTPGVSALFYVNGILVATQTTNLPTTGTPSIVYGDSGGDSIVTSSPVVSIQN